MRAARRLAAAALLAGGALAAGACGSAGDTGGGPAEAAPPTSAEPADPVPAAVQRLDISGTEYAFEMAPTGDLEPGWTTVSFRNDGAEAHQVMFAAPKEGVDLAELAAVAGQDSSGAAAIEYVDMIGGVSYIGPGQTIDAMVDLPAGTVMAMCYVPDPDGVAHALRGMSSVLTVGGGDGGTAPAQQDPDPVAGTIELAEDGYRLPDAMPAGWYRVRNTDRGDGGEGLHELSILRLGRSASADEVDALVDDLAVNATPAVPVEALGGLGAISPGLEGYVHLDLPPGDYVAVDFMPDPGDSRPHLLDGYYAAFAP